MASDSKDWSVPASVRALLWWPPVAFILVTIRPEAAPLAIAAAGAALAVIGVVGSVLAKRLSARAGGEPVAAPVAFAAPDRMTAAPAEQRAA